MKKVILENGCKLIYKKQESRLTSICISIDAGACVEGEIQGIAHAVEHMVYKGTTKRDEKSINRELNNIFGFQNAMTNYPYVIYYGTLLEDDFEKGIELFSDIILNPIFSEEGFKEEMDVIKEELFEWDEELDQYCEDKLFFNVFDNRRIKTPIIGTKESLEKITIYKLKEFYKKHYIPQNTSISVVSSLDFDKVKNIVLNYFNCWIDTEGEKKSENLIYEKPKQDIFFENKSGNKTSKIQIICPISDLNYDEMKALKLFNQYFCGGVNSVLYDNLRTRRGLIYDVISKIAHEKYIKLYKIIFSTSKDKVEETINIIKNCISALENSYAHISEDDIKNMARNLEIKKLFMEEKSIVTAKELATYDSMFGNHELYMNELEGINSISKDKILEVGKKVLSNLSIQIIL